MFKTITVHIKRNSIWVYNIDLNLKQYWLGDSKDLFRSIANSYNIRAKKYTTTLDLYDDKKKILKLPISYGINNLLEKLYSNPNLTIEIIDDSNKYNDYTNIKNIQMKPNIKPRDEIQEKSIEFLTSVINTSDRPKDVQHWRLLSLDTGMGKTFVAIYAAVQLKLPILIASGNLSQQWIDKLKEYTNAKDEDIFEIRGRDSLNKLLFKNKVYPFYVASISTVRDFMKQFKSVNTLFYKLNIGCLIIDESHQNYKSLCNIINNSETKYIFMLTATPKKSNYLENRVYQHLFRHVPTHGIETHTMNTHYNIRFITYNTYPNAADVRYCATYKGFSSVKYYKYIYANKNKSLLIVGMIKYFADQILQKFPAHRILCYIPTLEFMDYVYKFLTINYNLSYSVGQYNNNIKSLERREKELEKNLILTTMAAGSTGKDIPNLKAIFSLTPFSSEILARQALGRLRPLKDGGSVYFYDFTDLGFSATKIQATMRAATLKPRANSIESKFINGNDMILYLGEEENNQKYYKKEL